jgi:hypothetical protein
MPRTRSPITFARSLSRAFARYTVAGTLAGGLALAAAQPALADPINSGQVGSYTDTTCGWYPQDTSLLDLWPYKIVRINLPSVSGVTAQQLIWAKVEFVQPDGTGEYNVYRSGWFYTYTSPGQLTTTWTSYATGESGLSFTDDAPGESGYASGDTQNPVTVAFVQLYWMTGSTATGTADEEGVNPASPEYPNLCNGGGTL